MGNLSLRSRKIEEIQRQQKELKKSLLGRQNTNTVQEIPLMQRTMQRTMQTMQKERRKKVLLREHKKKSIASKQKARKQYAPKCSIKSFY